jgi:hypothetical protein
MKNFNKGWAKVRLLRKEMPDAEQERIIGLEEKAGGGNRAKAFSHQYFHSLQKASCLVQITQLLQTFCTDTK